MLWTRLISFFLIDLSLSSLQGVRAANTTVLHSDQAVTYQSPAAWSRVANLCAGVGYSTSVTIRSWATLSFQGTAIEAQLLTTWAGGLVYILIDDVMQTPFTGLTTADPKIYLENCIPWSFSKSNLQMGRHNITVINASGGTTAIYRFVYTTPDSPSSSSTSAPSPSSSSGSSSPSSLPACAPSSSLNAFKYGFIAAVVALLLVAAYWAFTWYQNRNSTSQSNTGISGNVNNNGPSPEEIDNLLSGKRYS